MVLNQSDKIHNIPKLIKRERNLLGDNPLIPSVAAATIFFSALINNGNYQDTIAVAVLKSRSIFALSAAIRASTTFITFPPAK